MKKRGFFTRLETSPALLISIFVVSVAAFRSRRSSYGGGDVLWCCMPESSGAIIGSTSGAGSAVTGTFVSIMVTLSEELITFADDLATAGELTTPMLIALPKIPIQIVCIPTEFSLYVAPLKPNAVPVAAKLFETFVNLDVVTDIIFADCIQITFL